MRASLCVLLERPMRVAWLQLGLLKKEDGDLDTAEGRLKSTPMISDSSASHPAPIPNSSRPPEK